VGDIKYLWELNRHLHIVTLAQAYALSGDARYFGVIRATSKAGSPNAHTAGAQTVERPRAGIRLINWSVAWQLLGGASSPLFQRAKARGSGSSG